MTHTYQTPLFLEEIKNYLREIGAEKVIDGTFGEGGHGFSLAQEGICVLGLDWDNTMFRHAKELSRQKKLEDKVTLYNGNFAQVSSIATKLHFLPVDAVILDLGLSMRQIATSGKGFTYKGSEPLDLRLSGRLRTTAAAVIKTLDKATLRELFTRHIEDVHSQALADIIIKERTIRPIKTTEDLIAVIAKLRLPSFEHKSFVRKVLQGLRMMVNSELENIDEGLKGAERILRKKGLIIIITFHSLEDRAVKLFFKRHAGFNSLVDKPLANRQHTFAKGAKLRVYQKT